MTEPQQIAKAVGDVGSFSVLVGALADLLPGVATLLTCIWVAIRIYETETVRRWLKRKG